MGVQEKGGDVMKLDLELDTLAEQAGIDTTVCEFCYKPLDGTKPWRRGLDGCGAHEKCIKRFL